jgi:uncharacterized C2H2 Zn-finger protein
MEYHFVCPKCHNIFKAVIHIFMGRPYEIICPLCGMTWKIGEKPFKEKWNRM